MIPPPPDAEAEPMRTKMRKLVMEVNVDTAWMSADSAPKEIVYCRDGHCYGPYITGYPVAGGGVARVRWWQTEDGKASNFLDDGGNAAMITHWMSQPAPPVEGGWGPRR